MKRILAIFASLLALTASAATLNPIQLLNPAGSTSGQVIRSTGPSTAPAWGNVTATNLAAQAANTVVANATASSASPTAVAMPSCSSSTSALQWTSGTGFTCYANSASLAGAAFTGVVSVTDSSNSASTLLLTNTGALGSTIKLVGNGSTTPSKTLKVVNGSFRITNDAASANTFTLDDSGNGVFAGTMQTTGGITNSPISGSTGSFTTLSATGLITPSSTVGIKGTATNDNPAAGSFGEYVNAQTLNTSMTSGTAANCASLALTAGDWDVTGVIVYIPAGTTTVQSLNSGVTSASATAAAFPNYVATFASFTTGASQAIQLPTVRFSSPSGITAYAVGVAGFGVSTMQCSGFLRARRPR